MSEKMLALMLKSKTNQPLTDKEQQQLDEWLSRSESNIKPGNSSSKKNNSSIPVSGLNPVDDSFEDDGSANAFEGTENSKEYEKDMSDEELDDEIT